MNHSFVHLDAESAGEAMITKASGFTPVIEDKLSCDSIEFESCHARGDPLRHLGKSAACEFTSLAHFGNLFWSLNKNHLNSDFTLECAARRATLDATMFHQAVILMHDKMTFDDAEGVEDDTDEDE